MFGLLRKFPTGAGSARWVVVLGLGVTALAGFAAAYLQNLRNDDIRAVRFDAVADKVPDLLRRQFQIYEYGLQGTRSAVIAAADGLSRDRFRSYSRLRNLAKEFPGSRGFGLIKIVPRDRTEAFLEQARQDGSPGFKIQELGRQTGDRFLIQYEAGNISAQGIDISSDSNRRDAALAAMESGEARLTAPITLEHVSAKPSHSLMFLLPVYDPSLPVDTPEQRRVAAVGWSYSPLIIDEVLNSAHLTTDEFAISIADKKSRDGKPFYETSNEETADVSAQFRRFDFSAYGRDWQIEVRSQPLFVQRLQLVNPALTGSVTCAFGLLFTTILHLHFAGIKRRERAWLERSRLAAIVDQSNEAIVGTTLTGEVTDWNPAAEQLFGYKVSEVLGKNLSSLIVPTEHIEDRNEALKRMLETKARVQLTTQRRSQDGKILDMIVNMSPIRSEQGKIVGIGNSASDITSFVKAKKELQELNESLGQQVNERTAELFQQAAEIARVNLRFKSALDNMSHGLCLFDKDKNLVISNDRFRDMYGLTEHQVEPGTPLSQILQAHADNGEKSADSIESHVARMSTTENEIFELADGRVISIRRKVMSEGGWVATHEDITQQRQLEQERDQHRKFLHRIIERIPTQITVKDARDRRYVLLNRAAEAQLGPASEVVGRTAYEVFSRTAADIITGNDDEALRSENGVFRDEHEFESRSGGSARFITTMRVPIREDEGDHPSYLINLVEDVTERKLSNDRIAYLAHHDLLTGLANRAQFAEKLDEAAKRCVRHDTPFAVLILDLDKFKNVNDTLGHPAGDQLLIEVAQRLRSSLRDTDVLARLGGDEFAIIQEGESNQHEGAIGLALRIIDILGAPFDLNGSHANIGTSIGIAFAPEYGLDAESLLKKADLALYAAKSEGRNDYRLFRPEMVEASDTQRMLEGELRDAIQREEFELHYQPFVDARTGLIRGAEALVRWRHPVKGLVFPNEFIPLAESNGLMLPLGEWVLLQACKDAASWPPEVKVAVNISAVQLDDAKLFDIVLCVLVESGLSPERLELEVTETTLLKNEQACLLTVRQLRNLGVSIALDDFGIGYSSSSYLTRVPFNKIKIDRSFVQGFPGKRDCAAIIQSVLALGRGLDMMVTAEGVETCEQFEALQAAGVDLVQGYLFGRPVPLHELDFGVKSAKGKNVA